MKFIAAALLCSFLSVSNAQQTIPFYVIPPESIESQKDNPADWHKFGAANTFLGPSEISIARIYKFEKNHRTGLIKWKLLAPQKFETDDKHVVEFDEVRLVIEYGCATNSFQMKSTGYLLNEKLMHTNYTAGKVQKIAVDNEIQLDIKKWVCSIHKI